MIDVVNYFGLADAHARYRSIVSEEAPRSIDAIASVDSPVDLHVYCEHNLVIAVDSEGRLFALGIVCKHLQDGILVETVEGAKRWTGRSNAG